MGRMGFCFVFFQKYESQGNGGGFPRLSPGRAIPGSCDRCVTVIDFFNSINYIASTNGTQQNQLVIYFGVLANWLCLIPNLGAGCSSHPGGTIHACHWSDDCWEFCCCHAESGYF
jgi:hypothetical protein